MVDLYPALSKIAAIVMSSVGLKLYGSVQQALQTVSHVFSTDAEDLEELGARIFRSKLAVAEDLAVLLLAMVSAVSRDPVV